MKNFNKMAQCVLDRRDEYVLCRKKQMKKLAAAVSCFCICAILGVGAWQLGGRPAPPASDPSQEALANQENYIYQVDTGAFSAYVGGKVIDEGKLGSKIEDVTLTAGWKSAADGKWLSQEALRGEVYAIDGIESSVAVALKLLDKGEAVTTTHYYVIMNPNADLSAVQDYIIP